MLTLDSTYLFATTESRDLILEELVKAIADTLKVDRCFLYVRDPETRLGQAAFCYCRNPEVPNVSNKKWEQEQPEKLEAIDPMFAAALNCQPAIFVEDVETADPDLVNRDFEAKAFGHRALIHAHFCDEGQLWGILQPCVFGRPRKWLEEDKRLIATVVEQVTPLVKQYVEANRQGLTWEQL